jgi:hypothetical protein
VRPMPRIHVAGKLGPFKLELSDEMLVGINGCT